MTTPRTIPIQPRDRQSCCSVAKSRRVSVYFFLNPWLYHFLLSLHLSSEHHQHINSTTTSLSESKQSTMKPPTINLFTLEPSTSHRQPRSHHKQADHTETIDIASSSTKFSTIELSLFTLIFPLFRSFRFGEASTPFCTLPSNVC